MNASFCWRSGVVLLGLAVALGAFGAHALRDVLDETGRRLYHTAFLYQVIHGFALLTVAIALTVKGNAPLLRISAVCFLSGTVLFSGSVYALALSAPRWLGALTPLGGLLFLIGWFILWAAGWR